MHPKEHNDFSKFYVFCVYYLCLGYLRSTKCKHVFYALLRLYYSFALVNINVRLRLRKLVVEKNISFFPKEKRNWRESFLIIGLHVVVIGNLAVRDFIILSLVNPLQNVLKFCHSSLTNNPISNNTNSHTSNHSNPINNNTSNRSSSISNHNNPTNSNINAINLLWN